MGESGVAIRQMGAGDSRTGDFDHTGDSMIDIEYVSRAGCSSFWRWVFNAHTFRMGFKGRRSKRYFGIRVLGVTVHAST